MVSNFLRASGIYFLHWGRYFFNLGSRQTLSRLPIYLLLGGVCVQFAPNGQRRRTIVGARALSGRIWPAVLGHGSRGGVSQKTAHSRPLARMTHLCLRCPVFGGHFFRRKKFTCAAASVIHLRWRRRFCDKRVYMRGALTSHTGVCWTKVKNAQCSHGALRLKSSRKLGRSTRLFFASLSPLLCLLISGN
jgi:hypothetical protein